MAILKKARELLREEIDLRDVPDKAQINIPGTLAEWPGTAFVAGSSGSGKGYMVCSTILRHWKTSTPLNRRHVFWCTPELDQDRTLAMIRDVKKFEPWFHGIDVSFDAFENSGQSKEQFFRDRVKNVVDSQRNSIFVADDFQDSAVPNLIRKFVDRKLRTGRHLGQSTWTMQHSLRNSTFSRQAVQSCKYTILFAQSQRGKVTQFLKDSVGIGLAASRELTALMASCGRHATLRMHSPMMLICDDYVKLL